MAKVFLAATFSLTLVRTGLVLDAVCSHGGGVVGRAGKSTRHMLSHNRSQGPLPRQHTSTPGGGAPKTRLVGVEHSSKA